MVRCSTGASAEQVPGHDKAPGLLRQKFDVLQRNPIFKQTLNFHAIGGIVDSRQRLQRNLLLAQIEMLAAQCLGQHESRIALVHEEDLHTRERRGRSPRLRPSATLLPAPVGPSMVVWPVSPVKIETPRRAAGGRAIAERRRALGG